MSPSNVDALKANDYKVYIRKNHNVDTQCRPQKPSNYREKREISTLSTINHHPCIRTNNHIYTGNAQERISCIYTRRKECSDVEGRATLCH